MRTGHTLLQHLVVLQLYQPEFLINSEETITSRGRRQIIEPRTFCVLCET